MRELKRWSRMILDLVSRGFKVSYAVQEAFVQVYFPLSGQTREDGAPPGNGLLDICRWASESSSGGNWYQPNSWPVPISTDLVACESNSAMLLRDIGPMLSLIGRSCERIMGDVLAGMCKRPLDFNMVPLSFASIVMVPGNYLAQLCCGSSSSSVLNRGDGPQFELSLAAVEVALYMFLDGTHLNPIQIEYFVHILQRCRELCKRLDFLGHIALLDIHLDQWMKLAKVYSTYPLLDRLTSRIKSTVKQEIGMRLSLDHVKKEMTQSGPDTILQLSCWRFHNIVSRNRFSVVHAVIDALWPFFAAAVDLQEAFLSNCYTSIYDAEEKVSKTLN